MENQGGLGRLVNFSDAVVAIAATLLILPLVDIAEPDPGGDTWSLVSEHSVDIFAFALSFVVIFVLWLAHHRAFHGLVGFTPLLAWANLLWLISIVFLPFPTRLIAEKNGFDASASGLYVGTIALAVVALLAIEVIVTRNPSLAPDRRTHSWTTGATSTGLILIALLLTFTPLGLYALLLMFLTTPINRIIDRRLTH